MKRRNRLKKAALAACLSRAVIAARAQSQVWNIPRASVRAVLEQWARDRHYGVVWSEGIPDFRTRESRVEGDFASVAAWLVDGSAYGSKNLYCPPALTFPAMAYFPAIRVDEQARLVFVYGVPTLQECRPL